MKGIKEADEISDFQQLSDEELAREAGAGSHRCFELLVFRYSSRLFQFLRSRISTDQDAEDLTQDTLVKAFQNIKNYDPNYKFSTWIYTIASRLAIDFFRTQGRKTQMTAFNTFTDALPDSASHSDPHENLLQDDYYKNMWLTARTLKPDQYEALWLRYAEDLPLKEIAEVMNKSQIYVRVLLHRARLKLSHAMQQTQSATEGGSEGSSAPSFSGL